jgi:hypothetical protein
MRLVLSAAFAVSLLSGAALAGQDDEILSDLVVVTAAPRPTDVKMVVQPAKPAPAQAPAPSPAQDAAKPVKIASK